MSTLIHNERIKAAANLLNSAANACFAHLSGIINLAVLIGNAVWLVALAYLHFVAFHIGETDR
jgi:hypothetical protein